ncbi:hypothetical protein SAMN04488564_103642 [Lentzea waywayandensis]|uniref:Uncharacterized protein n=1 Tax=Lentzea waywayandensis TaxID=84724 RepID=A0A1I6E1Y4_9PSEU|nr:hypothetical protein SAMN04488564_103642 [Lentzea waywayandensis]
MATIDSLIQDFAVNSRRKNTQNRVYVGGVNTVTGEIALASSGTNLTGCGVSHCAKSMPSTHWAVFL